MTPSIFNPFRVITCLLVADARAVKTTRFRNPKYVGDILNVVRIFNEKMVDELAILDISAARERRAPNLAFLETLASECFMPLAYGGGVQSARQVKEIINLGVEKVIMNTTALEQPHVLREAADLVGRQSIVASLDVRRNWRGNPVPHTRSGTRKLSLSIDQAVRTLRDSGAGEILLSSIDREGTLSGMDRALIKQVTAQTQLPVVAMGGAARCHDLAEAVGACGAAAVAAGAMFIYRGPHRAVLPNYPTPAELNAAIVQHRELNA